MVVMKAPCIVKGNGEDARQELAPKLSIDRVKGTWKAIIILVDTHEKMISSESRGMSNEVSVMEMEQ
jgi:hypothetical protein